MATAFSVRGLSGERLFFGAMGLAILALVFAGFAPTYFLRGVMDAGRPLAPLAPLVHVHGIVFSAWIILFIGQTALISTRRPKWHRRVGYAAAALATAMIVVGLLTGARQLAIGINPASLPPAMWFALPFWSLVAFAVLVSAGLAFRRNPQAHKRLMLLATLGMLQPAVGRMSMPFHPLGAETNALMAFLMVVPLIVWDLKRKGAPHRATLFGIAVLAAEQLIRVTTWHTEGWQSFAAALATAIA